MVCESMAVLLIWLRVAADTSTAESEWANGDVLLVVPGADDARRGLVAAQVLLAPCLEFVDAQSFGQRPALLSKVAGRVFRQES